MNITESYRKRIQELAGIGIPQSEARTLAKGFKEFEQTMGQGSIDKILNYIRTELKQPFTVSSMQEDKITFSSPNGYFLLFKGYLTDLTGYSFNIGCTDRLGEEVFKYSLEFDMDGNPCNLKSLNFGSY